VAAQCGRSPEETRRLIDSAQVKMLAARVERPTPFIDRTLYTSWNAMAVTAYIEAARVLRADGPRAFALLTLDRILSDAWDGVDSLQHVIAYGESDSNAPAGRVAGTLDKRVSGTLDDYAMTVHACVDGWIASGEMRYYYAAVKLADAMIAKFYDRTAGAFFDTASGADGAIPLGALTARRKPLQDSPTPAGNPTAAAALLRLEELGGRKEYREIAEDSLESFAGIVEHFGLYAGSYGLALEQLLVDPMQVVIVGGGPEADELEALAMARFAINKTVIRLAPEKLVGGGLPEALAETVLQVPKLEGKAAWALVCRGRTCMPPVADSEALMQALG
jgi:uncharacterized protein YyaL (SSP411 family)